MQQQKTIIFPHPRGCSDFNHHILVLPFLEFHKNYKQNLLCVASFIHIFMCINSFYFLWLTILLFILICHIYYYLLLIILLLYSIVQFDYSFGLGCLSSFQLGNNMNKAAIFNILGHKSYLDICFISLE